MITYQPLLNTLKEKNMTIRDLERLMNNYHLKRTLNTRSLVTLDTVNKICDLLNCNVSDVINYQTGAQDRVEIKKYMYVVDWEAVCKKMSGYALSKALGKSRSYISVMKKRECVSRSVMDSIINVLDCKPSEVCKEIRD